MWNETTTYVQLRKAYMAIMYSLKRVSCVFRLTRQFPIGKCLASKHLAARFSYKYDKIWNAK